MIPAIVDFAVRRKVFVFAVGILLLVWGAYSFHRLPVEAYSDVTNTYVQVITQWPGHAAEEIEQQITMPVEAGLNGLGHLEHLRSLSLLGLSAVTLIFDDDADNYVARQQVLEKLSRVDLPPHISPQLSPDSSPLGQIYWYTLTSTNPQFGLRELKALQDWYLEREFKSVPNIVEVSGFGGLTREYEVRIDPNKLLSYGLNIRQVEQELAANNDNVGGGSIERGEQAFNIRAVALVNTTDEIGEVALTTRNGTTVRVRDVADVVEGAKIRLGKIGKTIRREDGQIIDDDDLVEGIVLMRKGAPSDETIAAVNAKVKQLNNELLPPGVKIVPYLNRGDLLRNTTRTVAHNLTVATFLVIAVSFLALGSVRAVLIVGLSIPFSLLFVSIFLGLRQIPANLLALSALDVGMVAGGAVVVIENVFRHVSRGRDLHSSVDDKVKIAVHEVERPVFYTIAISFTAYLSIFTLQNVEGRLFRPMAATAAIVLIGALAFSLVLAPALASFFFQGGVREWRSPVLAFLIRIHRRSLTWCIHHRWLTVGVSLILLIVASCICLPGVTGAEFLPHADEGTIWARGTLPSSVAPTEATRLVRQARKVFAQYPEVTTVASQVGRPEDGTDAAGFFNTEYFIDLKPRDQWRHPFWTEADLISSMSAYLRKEIPGVIWNFSQPIQDNLEEAASGVKGQHTVKLFGPDLKILEEKGEHIVKVMDQIRGVSDLGLLRVGGQPNVTLTIDRVKANRFGISISDIQEVVEVAVSGKAVSQVIEGERHYNLVVRYQEPYRGTVDDIGDIQMLAPSGQRVALSQVCDIKIQDSPSIVYREANLRYIPIKYSVRGRDLENTVKEAVRTVKEKIKLPHGYHLDWTGEYDSQKRAEARFLVIVPITILVIFIVLYSMFDSFKWAFMVLFNIGLARIGGLLALFITGTYFSVSSSVGFLVLFGMSVQTGVIMVDYMNQLRARGYSVVDAAREGALQRLRAIFAIMSIAAVGLLPATLSHAIGSDSQRPFAIVIVGGLITDLIMSAMLLPTLYVSIARPDDKLPQPCETPAESSTVLKKFRSAI
jgi:heavy metal efflux system protein